MRRFNFTARLTSNGSPLVFDLLSICAEQNLCDLRYPEGVCVVTVDDNCESCVHFVIAVMHLLANHGFAASLDTLPELPIEIPDDLSTDEWTITPIRRRRRGRVSARMVRSLAIDQLIEPIDQQELFREGGKPPKVKIVLKTEDGFERELVRQLVWLWHHFGFLHEGSDPVHA